MKPPSEIAALLRELPDTEPRKPLEDELARSLRSWLERELKKRCSKAGVTADLEDATHELFVKLFENIRTGTPPPQHGREDADVVRTAHNKANDILKGEGRFGFRKHLDSPDSIPRATSGRTHEDAIETAELAAILREAIEELHPTAPSSNLLPGAHSPTSSSCAYTSRSTASWRLSTAGPTSCSSSCATARQNPPS